MNSATLTVGEVAREAGVSASAVRFYERHGVVCAQRTEGNQRRFHASAPCILRVAKVAQRSGMTVREIAAAFADLPDEPGPADWGRFSQTVVAEAERRVAELRGLLEELGEDRKLCDLTA